MTDTATELTFEAGYQRLQDIAARLSQDEVPVSEMCALFGEGKGLESALTGFLDTQRAKVESIERGEGVHAFRIVGATSSAPAGVTDDDIDWDGASTSDFVPSPKPANPASAEDDIPF